MKTPGYSRQELDKKRVVYDTPGKGFFKKRVLSNSSVIVALVNDHNCDNKTH